MHLQAEKSKYFTHIYIGEGIHWLRRTWDIYSIHVHTQEFVFTRKYTWVGKVHVAKCIHRIWMGYMGKGMFAGLYIHIHTMHNKDSN